jgi:hypothetical protein
MHPGDKGGERKKTTVFGSWESPRDVAGYLRTGKWDTKAVQQEAMFCCAGTDSVDLCPKAEP